MLTTLFTSVEEYAAGAVHIFSRTDGVWSGTQKIVASDRFERDDFGRSVGISGNNIVVGHRNWLYGDGAAYIFEKSNSSWSQTSKLLPSDLTDTEMLGFGSNVVIDGNYVVVSAHHSSTDESGENMVDNAGAVYIFERDSSSGTWSEIHKLVPNDRTAGDVFGSGISMDGDNLLVGAMYDDTAGSDSNAGSAYIFEIY